MGVSGSQYTLDSELYSSIWVTSVSMVNIVVQVADIAVVGTGYVGLSCGACLSALGHRVTCIDIDSAKIEQLNRGEIPIYEEGLEDLVKRCSEESRLLFTTNLQKGLEEADFVFLCLPTPQRADGSADLSFLITAVTHLAPYVADEAIVVIKSTVPMGTHSRVEELLVGRKVHVATSPEFVREGSAVKDFFNPDRIIIGTRTQSVAEKLERVFDGIDSTILVTDPESAETIKNASNSFLAMKLSYINAMAIICELYGADILDVSRGIGLDSRIGSNFLQAGPGWGGSCLPKDANSLAFTANAKGYSFTMLQEAIAINEHMQTHIVKKTEELVGGNLRGSKIAVWGLTFKANTDDLRDSPAIRIVSQLLLEGASISCFDPMVRANQKSIFGANIHDSIEKSAKNSDLILVLTEWNEFREVDPGFIGGVMANRNVFDCRNVLNKENWEKAGFVFKALGRA